MANMVKCSFAIDENLLELGLVPLIVGMKRMQGRDPLTLWSCYLCNRWFIILNAWGSLVLNKFSFPPHTSDLKPAAQESQ